MSPAENFHESDFLDTQLAFAKYIRNPDDSDVHQSVAAIEPRRLKIYSELFYNNIEGFVVNNFPVLHSIIVEEVWHKIIRLFMVEYRCQSPIFAEIGREFIQFLESDAFQTSELRPLLSEFVIELAYYEWMELVISIDTHVIDWPKAKPITNDLNAKAKLLSGRVNVSSLAKLGHFAYPVQNISEEYIPDEEDKQETLLLIYRDREHEVNFMSLAPVAGILFQRLSELQDESSEKSQDAHPVSVESILTELHEQLNFNNWIEFEAAGITIIDDWLQKDILYY